mgnify:CR=1 FL=1
MELKCEITAYVASDRRSFNRTAYGIEIEYLPLRCVVAKLLIAPLMELKSVSLLGA